MERGSNLQKKRRKGGHKTRQWPKVRRLGLEACEPPRQAPHPGHSTMGTEQSCALWGTQQYPWRLPTGCQQSLHPERHPGGIILSTPGTYSHSHQYQQSQLFSRARLEKWEPSESRGLGVCGRQQSLRKRPLRGHSHVLADVT